MNKQKGNTTLLVIVIVIVVVALFALWLNRNTGGNGATSPVPTVVTNQAINSPLTQAENELNSADLDILDNDLNQNDKDAASF